MKTIDSFVERKWASSVDELFEFLRIPSVSADSQYKSNVREAAEWLLQSLQAIQVDARLYETKGNPIVYGEYKIADDAPTVLFYGHYDVQPADPIDLWDTDPFKPEIKKTKIHPEGAIFARGACDDKGQLLMQIKAVDTLINNELLKCNVKFIYEGEEEVGSVNLEPFCREHQELLKADVIMICDTSILSNSDPSVTTGLRGLSYVEVEVRGPNKDLHSGVYGGAVANPINILSTMIAELHNDVGRITIPGFYDDVEEVSEEERRAMGRAPFDLEEYMEELGIREVQGEEGYTTIERASIRPTLDVNGIWGGYTGEGSKTVLPAKASAKISMRLVPHQNPDKITELFSDYFKSIAPASVEVTVRPLHGGMPAVTPVDSDGYRAASTAMESTFGKEPLPMRSGGSIPIVAMFREILGTDSILMGFGLDSDSIHSPNEHYGLFNYRIGIRTLSRFLINFSEITT